MNRIISDEEKINIALFRDYGITEWREKCLILTKGEQEFVLKHLNDEQNDLIQMVKLPFPHFAEKYFEKYTDKFQETPNIIREQLGYNLYMLRDYQIKSFADFMRGNKEIPSKVKYYDLKDAFEDLRISFDSHLKVDRNKLTYKDTLCKKIYISQYIDAQEAERLKLTDHTFRLHGVYQGFNLEEKLDCLNGITQTVLRLTLGTNGYYRHKQDDIFEIYGTQFPIQELNKMLLSALSKSTNEFKSKIGLNEEDYDSKSFKTYNYKPFQKFDFDLNYRYYIRNVLTDNEKEVLSHIPISEQKIYVASKYFYSSVKKIRNVLDISIQDASKYVEETRTGISL